MMNLTYIHQTRHSRDGKYFLKQLKAILDAKSQFKLGFDKCNKVMKLYELDYQKEFFSIFLSKYATKKKVFEFNCYQKVNVSRFPLQKTENSLVPITPKRKFKKFYKLYKDQLQENNFKQKLMSQKDFNFFLSRQNACISIFLVLFLKEREMLMLGFKRILMKALSSVSHEEMTGFKGFSKYSIILFPFKGSLFELNAIFLINS